MKTSPRCACSTTKTSVASIRRKLRTRLGKVSSMLWSTMRAFQTSQAVPWTARRRAQEQQSASTRWILCMTFIRGARQYWTSLRSRYVIHSIKNSPSIVRWPRSTTSASFETRWARTTRRALLIVRGGRKNWWIRIWRRRRTLQSSEKPRNCSWEIKWLIARTRRRSDANKSCDRSV